MTPQERKVMQMALEVLEHGLPIIEDYGGKRNIQLQHKAIAVLYEALRAALANEFNPDWDAMAVMVEEQQRMAKRIEELKERLLQVELNPPTAQLAQPEQEPVGNTITFMTRAIFNVVASHQEINGGYFIADGDVAAFVDRLAKVINSTFEPLKPKNTAPPQREWHGLTDEEQNQVAWSCGAMSADWLDFARAIEAKLREKNS